jgi:homoserine O-acetyltransferase
MCLRMVTASRRLARAVGLSVAQALLWERPVEWGSPHGAPGEAGAIQRVKHLKLVLGTSKGGMQTWLWGEMFPNDMDCLVAIASTPAAISGRNMIWREMVSQAIRGDPAWKNGDYPKDSPPKNWINAVIPLSAIMTGSAEQLQKQGPTRATAIDLVKNLEASGEAYDANDMLYDFESSADYDPAPNLNVINKPMLTINFSDDLTNPPSFCAYLRHRTTPRW